MLTLDPAAVHAQLRSRFGDAVGDLVGQGGDASALIPPDRILEVATYCKSDPGLVFVIFDVELAFVYPVVTVFRTWVADGRGVFALTEIAVFIGILAVGLVYVWVKGDLEWLKRLPAERPGMPAERRAA